MICDFFPIEIFISQTRRFFKGDLEIDGVPKEQNLFQLVASTLGTSNDNNVIAFNDNSSAIRGKRVHKGRFGPTDRRTDSFERL